MYAGDEFYSDEITSGPAEDDGFEMTAEAYEYFETMRAQAEERARKPLTADDRLRAACYERGVE